MQKNKNLTNVKIVKEINPIIKEIIAELGWIVTLNNKGTILFTTPLLNKHIPKNGTKSWLNHNSFTFSIFYHKKFYLISKILPCNNKTHTLLSNSLSNIKSIKQPKTNQLWVNHILHNTNLSISDFANKNKSQIKTILKNNLQQITTHVKKVEAAILLHKKELKNLPPYPDAQHILQRTQKSKFRIIKPLQSIQQLASVA